jgi:uncharacterized membrane protein SpoIIM required for sporulation
LRRIKHPANPQSKNLMSRFINERKNNWQRLEDLLSMVEHSPLRGLSKAEVREFGELYRRAASDLAIARAETRDPRLINYLNSLVIRAHGKIYRADNNGLSLIWQFFAKDFPAAFRRTWRYTALAFLIFTGFGVAAFILSFNDSAFAEMIGVEQAGYLAKSNTKWWESLNEANQIGASEILTNNIMVALRAFAYGAFFGIGTIYVLIFNGLHIGGILGVCYRANPAFANELVTFMVGHGVIELSCIFIAGGAGMLIGYSMINPGDLSRGEALRRNGLVAVRLAVGCTVLLVIAGIIEGFLSPANLPPAVKFATGILTGVAMFSYLLLVGEKQEEIIKS